MEGTRTNGLSHANPHILVVDDDVHLRGTLAEYLETQGFATSLAGTLHEAREHLARDAIALVVLDLMLGAENGLDLLRRLKLDGELPIIIVTGHRRDEIDRVVGLELGADDYLTKPFSLRELIARVRTVLRRTGSGQTNPPTHASGAKVRFEGWTLDKRGRQLHDPEGQQVSLSRTEFALLSALVDAPGEPLSREALLQATRKHEDVFDRSIDVQILRLRRKLEPTPSEPRLVKTERGFGYTFAASVEFLR